MYRSHRTYSVTRMGLGYERIDANDASERGMVGHNAQKRSPFALHCEKFVHFNYGYLDVYFSL